MKIAENKKGAEEELIKMIVVTIVILFIGIAMLMIFKKIAHID